MFRTQNLCLGSKSVFDSRQKHFLSPRSKICFRNTFPARLNWETFASATMFPSLASHLPTYLDRKTNLGYIPYVANEVPLLCFKTINNNSQVALKIFTLNKEAFNFNLTQ